MAALTVVCKETLTDCSPGYSMQRDSHRSQHWIQYAERQSKLQHWILCRETVKGSPGYAKRQTDDSTVYYAERQSMTVLDTILRLRDSWRRYHRIGCRDSQRWQQCTVYYTEIVSQIAAKEMLETKDWQKTHMCPLHQCTSLKLQDTTDLVLGFARVLICQASKSPRLL